MTVFTLQKMQFLRKLMVIHNRGFSYDGARDGGSQRLKYIFYSFRALGLLSKRYRFSMKSSKCVGSMDQRWASFNLIVQFITSLQSKGDFDIFILTNKTSSHKISGANVKGVKKALIDVRKADEEAESRGNKRGTNGITMANFFLPYSNYFLKMDVAKK
ncbi:hypothetical protein PVK06_009073 [Gossypium arboreum]|uniref:Uncharacterized protein n=1 Tax=Gossypium arboreum TaxID=29729 RepID=A0ABR0QMX2_GOSAR|nr:hypothetical protein PVK06_009073 [Gossypium arboreum]